MIPEYLRILATSKSIEEFKLKLVIETDIDLDGKTMKEIEDDYLKRISSNQLYVKKLVKNGKIKLIDCFNCNLPILISDKNKIDNATLIRMRVLKVYDHNGIERIVNYNDELHEDLKAMYSEIDFDAMMMHSLQYELEKIK